MKLGTKTVHVVANTDPCIPLKQVGPGVRAYRQRTTHVIQAPGGQGVVILNRPLSMKIAEMLRAQLVQVSSEVRQDVVL